MDELILLQLLNRYPMLVPVQDSIVQAYELLCSCFAHGGKLLLCGNGGSAADCDHIAGELLKGFLRKRPLSAEQQALFSDPELAKKLQNGLPAISLCAHSALMTAVANDTDPAMVFAQQVWAYGQSGKDLLFALSTSGNAENTVHAAQTARAVGLPVVSITGADGGKLRAESTVCIRLPEKETFKVQELTLPVYHALCAAVEKHFYI